MWFSVALRSNGAEWNVRHSKKCVDCDFGHCQVRPATPSTKMWHIAPCPAESMSPARMPGNSRCDGLNKRPKNCARPSQMDRPWTIPLREMRTAFTMLYAFDKPSIRTNGAMKSTCHQWNSVRWWDHERHIYWLCDGWGYVPHSCLAFYVLLFIGQQECVDWMDGFMGSFSNPSLLLY